MFRQPDGFHFRDPNIAPEKAVDFAVRYGGRLQLLRRAMISGWRSRYEDVEACLDVDRHALVFQPISKGLFEKKRSTFAVACYNIRRVYISVARSRLAGSPQSQRRAQRRSPAPTQEVALANATGRPSGSQSVSRAWAVGQVGPRRRPHRPPKGPIWM